MASMAETGLSLGEVSPQPEVGMVPAGMIPLVWPGVLEILQARATEWLQTVSEEEVYNWLITGRADLWLGMQNCVLDGFVICQWEVHDRAKFYHVVYIAGDGLKKYLAIGLQQLERYSCILGAKEMIFEGRPGWQRVLRRYGYAPGSVRMKKAVTQLWSN